jgi:hypothetical protein
LENAIITRPPTIDIQLDTMETTQPDTMGTTQLDTMETTQMDTMEATQMDTMEATQLDTMETTQAQQATTTMNTLSEGCEDKTSGFGRVFALDSVVTVPCDGQGWAVFQRRVDGAFDFPTRTWAEYKRGFGDKEGSFWLGLEAIHRLTSTSRAMLRVELTSFEGETRYAQYASFLVEGEEAGYRLNISGFSGTAGDSLTYHNGMKFSTVDRDQDASSGTPCAERFLGAWWHKDCYYSNLNSVYRPTGSL